MTEYDQTWGNVTSIDNILANFKSSLQEMIDIMNNFSGKCEDVRALDKAIKEYEQGFNQANSTYTETERIAMLTKISDLKVKRDQLVSCSGCSISSARIAASADAECGAKAILCRDALKEMLGDVKEVEKDNLDPHYVDNINKEQQAYSCNCGWIDLNHAFTETRRKDAVRLGLGANNLWKQLKEENGKRSKYASGFEVKYTQDVLIFGTSVGVHKSYFVKFGLSNEVKKKIALAIFQEVSMEYEHMQKLNILSTSTFEPSDLVSNLLGFYHFVNDISKQQIEQLCNKLDATASLEIYKKYPETFSAERYKNRKFSPLFFKNSYCTINIFPKEFQTIQPAFKVLYEDVPYKDTFFRDWAYFDN